MWSCVPASESSCQRDAPLVVDTKAYIESPAPTTTYCIPSSSYVTGPFVIEVCNRACQSGAPVVALNATKFADASPAKSRFPAVLKRPERVEALPSHGCDHRILPVL